jgi:hypothetical protein
MRRDGSWRIWIVAVLVGVGLQGAVLAGSHSAESNVTEVDTRELSWIVRAWADKNGNNSYDAGEELSGAEVYYGSRTTSCGQTGPDGTLPISKAPRKWASILIRKAIHPERTVKAGHDAVDGWMFTLWIDSDVGATDSSDGDGTWRSYTLNAYDEATAYSGDPVNIQLAHPVFEWHLVVATEVSSSGFHDKLRAGFMEASKYLYDVTDGQMKFGKIAIYENVSQESNAWKRADIVVFNQSDYWPNAHVDGIRSEQPTHIHLGTTWGGFLGLSDDPDNRDYFRTIIHEFGHYAMGLYDEYKNGLGEEWGDRLLTWKRMPLNYGLMDSQYTASEMSAYRDYLRDYLEGVALSEITAEIAEHDLAHSASWYPCWQWVEHVFQRDYESFPIEIVVPRYGYYQGFGLHTSGARSGPVRIPDPYVPCVFTNIVTAAPSSGTVTVFSEASSVTPVIIQVLVNGVPVGGAVVVRHPNGQERVNLLGVTDKGGGLEAYGVGIGDVLVARYKGREGRLIVENPDASAPIQIQLEGAVKLTSQGPGQSLGEDHGILVWAGASLEATNWLDLRLVAGAALLGAPLVVIHPDDGAGESVNMKATSPNDYWGAVQLADAVGGTVELRCELTGAGAISSADQFALEFVTPTNNATVYSRDGWVDLHLVAGVTTTNALALIYAGNAPVILPAGFDKVKVGPVYCLSLGNGTNLNSQSAVLNIHYREADLVGVDETTIRLYEWDEAAWSWNEVPSSLSPDKNVLSVALTHLGVFALFAERTQDIIPPGLIAT